MRRLFGAKKEKAPPPSLEDTTSNLNSRGDTVDEKIRKLDSEMARYRDQLKRTRPGPAQAAIKQRAMRVLKQKRLYEGQRDQLYNQSFNLEQVSFATQQLKDTQTTVAAMKAANKEIKQQFKSVDINEIEALNDDLADQLDLSNEINEALGQTFGVPDDIDEEELMGELDALEDEMAMEGPSGAPSYLDEVEVPAAAAGEEQLGDLPAAPTGAAAAGQQEQQLDELGLPAVPQKQHS